MIATVSLFYNIEVGDYYEGFNKEFSSYIYSPIYIRTSKLCWKSHSREYRRIVDDSAITTKVKAALLAEPGIRSYQISVETFKGVVQLSGFVDTQQQKSKAGEIVWSVDGVRSVKNNILVKQPY